MATTIIGVDGCDIRHMTLDINYDGGLIYPPLGAWQHQCGMETKEEEVSCLHHFDFSEIDGGDIIPAASFFFYVTAVYEWGGSPPPQNEDYTYYIYRVLRSAHNSDDWITDEATWNIYHNGTPTHWGTAGCKGVADRTAVHAASYAGMVAGVEPAWQEVDVTDMVNDAHGEDQILNVLNCGYQIMMEGEALYFRYSSYMAEANKPYLSITHEPGAPPAFTPRVMIF